MKLENITAIIRKTRRGGEPWPQLANTKANAEPAGHEKLGKK
jgi:hypothetical protein